MWRTEKDCALAPLCVPLLKSAVPWALNVLLHPSMWNYLLMKVAILRTMMGAHTPSNNVVSSCKSAYL